MFLFFALKVTDFFFFLQRIQEGCVRKGGATGRTRGLWGKGVGCAFVGGQKSARKIKKGGYFRR